MQLNVVGILQFIVNNEKNGDFSKDKKDVEKMGRNATDT